MIYINNLIARAIRRGILVRPEACDFCLFVPGRGARGQALIHAHHPNGYGPGHELDVIWLCPVCHVIVHGNREDNWTDERRADAAERARNRTGWNHTEEARARIKAGMAASERYRKG